MTWLQTFKQNFCKSCIKEVTLDKDFKIKTLTDVNEGMKTQITQLNEELQNSKEENGAILEELNNLKNPDKLIKQLNEEYPEANVVYSGRTLPNSQTMCSVPVSILVTPNDWQIIKDLKDWGLYRTNEDHETLIPKIYKKILQKFYKYDYDINVWGKDEIWEWPFETRTRYSKGADCDSWAIVQASYYIASGVNPAFIWCVAGNTSLGGHCTVYVYSKNDSKFHHLNSTYGNMFETVSEFPTHKDAEEERDKIGISSVWFSFNNERSRTTFSTKATKDKNLKKFTFK